MDEVFEQGRTALAKVLKRGAVCIGGSGCTDLRYDKSTP
jgi:hypothetical protein